MNNDTDGNLAALAVYEKEQNALAQLEDFISKREDEMFDEIKAGTFNPERLIELQVIHFENNGEVDDLFRDLLTSNDEETIEITGVRCIDQKYAFYHSFHDCEHVQKQMQEWAEEDLNQEAEDNYNEAACEARDCEY